METGTVYPKLSEDARVKRLAPPVGSIRMDTDTFNEIDADGLASTSMKRIEIALPIITRIPESSGTFPLSPG